MDPVHNDVSATPPDGNEPSGTDSAPPNGDQTTRPDSRSEAVSSLSSPALDVETEAADKPAGIPRRSFVQGLVASGAALVAGAMLAGSATPASASIATPRPGLPNSWEASQGL